MEDHAGRCEYGAAGQSPTVAGPCRLSWDAIGLTATPAGGAPLVVDFGDIERFDVGDHQVVLQLHGGAALRLSRFGGAHAIIARDMREAARSRLLRCLLIADLRERARFDATVEVDGPDPLPGGPAEVRVFESNLAVLPSAGGGWQWRLADVDRIAFDAERHAWTMAAGARRLVVGRLARRTTEFGQAVGEARDAVRRRSATGLAAVFPWLEPAALAELEGSWREGRLTTPSALGRLDARLVPALVDRGVRPVGRPYFDALLERIGADAWRASYRLLHPADLAADGGAPAEAAGALADGDAGEEAAAGPAIADGREPLSPLFWFFVPFCSTPGLGSPDLVAWEAVSAGSRATYIFRTTDGLDAINAGLVSLNFRREPILLSDERLDADPALRHYAIAVRRRPELRALRRAFVGRAVHASREAWQRQLEQVIQSAI